MSYEHEIETHLTLRDIVISVRCAASAYSALSCCSDARCRCSHCCSAWQPADGPLKTRWAKDVSPENAHPEYPRPQMVRKDWLNLNGLWDFAIASKDATRATLPDADPRAVPGRVGAVRRDEARSARTSASGIGARSRCPRKWQGRRVLLHFGAVDWEATVWVNGKEVGEHRGGYDALQLRHHRRAQASRRERD